VLEQGIVKGAGSCDFFDTAHGRPEGLFDGVKLGHSNVQVDDSPLSLCVPWSFASHSPSAALPLGLSAARDYL
jgi:hypothetical protein